MYCIALLGGIPGCGKSELLTYFLANQQNLFETFATYSTTESIKDSMPCNEPFNDSANKNIRNVLSPQVHVISFDELCSVADQAIIVKTMNGWRHFRVQLLEAAERYICEVCDIECRLQGPLTLRSEELLQKIRTLNTAVSNDHVDKTDIIFLIEDNFYYRSMRYEWFQVAKRDGLGFCQVYLTCPVEVALERNLSRSYTIPEHRIRLMFSCMEYPDSQRNKWEKFSLLFDTTNELECHKILPIVELISNAMKEPAEMVLNQKKIEAQIVGSKNVIHQTDKVLRKITGEIIKDLKEEKNPELRKHAIQEIVSNRQKLLQELKQGSTCLPQNVTDIIESCGVQGSDVSSQLEVILRELFLEKCRYLCNGGTESPFVHPKML